jgi:flagellar protein FlgJ
MDDSRINGTPLPLPASGVKDDNPVGSEEKAKQEKKLRKACADFESILLYQMFKTMRNTIPQSGLTNKMTGKDTYEMMMDQKISEELAKKGGMGMQKVLFNQLNGQLNKGNKTLP